MIVISKKNKSGEMFIYHINNFQIKANTFEEAIRIYKIKAFL